MEGTSLSHFFAWNTSLLVVRENRWLCTKKREQNTKHTSANYLLQSWKVKNVQISQSCPAERKVLHFSFSPARTKYPYPGLKNNLKLEIKGLSYWKAKLHFLISAFCLLLFPMCQCAFVAYLSRKMQISTDWVQDRVRRSYFFRHNILKPADHTGCGILGARIKKVTFPKF